MSYESKDIIKEGKAYPMLILFGSQTGTAQRHAKIVTNFARSRNFDVTMKAMDDYTGDLSKEKLVIFVCSSYGNGEYPDNAIKFSKMLHDKAEAGAKYLEGVGFAVFGLGNSKFPVFNMAAKDLTEVCNQLGGRMLITPAFGDEMAPNGHEDAFHPWMQALWAVISAGPMKPTLLSDYSISPAPSGASLTIEPPTGYREVKVTMNKRLTPSDYERGSHLVQLSCPFDYQLCDHVSVCVDNPDAAVDRALKILHVDGDAPMEIKALAEETAELKMPKYCTMRKALKYYVAICDVPSRSDRKSVV